MKYILFAALPLLCACDGPSMPSPKIAAPQREALEQAASAARIVQESAEGQQDAIRRIEGE